MHPWISQHCNVPKEKARHLFIFFCFFPFIHWWVYHLLSSSTSPFYLETDHHDTLPELTKGMAEGSKLLGEILSILLMVLSIGGNDLIVGKYFKTWIHMQVEALLCVPSWSHILSWFSCRWNFIDNWWGWILGQTAQNVSGKRGNFSSPSSSLHIHSCNLGSLWHTPWCLQSVLFILHWGIPPAEATLLLHSILSLNVLKQSTAWHPTVCESEITMLLPLLLCDASVKILIPPCVLVILTWLSATQYHTILDDVLEVAAHVGQNTT